jgi:hypothetical protein
VGFIKAKGVQAAVMAPDLDVAVVRSVPLIERFENVDLMLAEMKSPRHGHSAMARMLLDVNTHFWFQGHSSFSLWDGPNFLVVMVHCVVPAKLATGKFDCFVLGGKRSHGPAARAHNAPCSRH